MLLEGQNMSRHVSSCTSSEDQEKKLQMGTGHELRVSGETQRQLLLEWKLNYPTTITVLENGNFLVHIATTKFRSCNYDQYLERWIHMMSSLPPTGVSQPAMIYQQTPNTWFRSCYTQNCITPYAAYKKFQTSSADIIRLQNADMR